MMGLCLWLISAIEVTKVNLCRKGGYDQYMTRIDFNVTRSKIEVTVTFSVKGGILSKQVNVLA